MSSMDNSMSNQLFVSMAKKKFYGHDKLHCKYDMKVPASAEREYMRVTNAYISILKEELEKHLPTIKEAYKNELKDEIERNKPNLHTDSETDLILIINQVFNEIRNKIQEKKLAFGLRNRLELLANMNRKLTIKEWKKAIKKTLGIDIFEDYYMGDFYKENIEKWIDANVDLISTMPDQSLDEMKRIVMDGFANGKPSSTVTKEIMKAYAISKTHAKLIARDQSAKLYSAIQKAQQEDAGVEEYKWSGVGDERERDSHRALNGLTFKWSDAPVNSDGRKCHPGEDYNCRCVALPVFHLNMNLPIKDEEKGENLYAKESNEFRLLAPRRMSSSG